MEKLKIGDRIVITNIQRSGSKRYWSSDSGSDPENIELPYETIVKTIKHGTGYTGVGDGTYGFWLEKMTWELANINYEIY